MKFGIIENNGISHCANCQRKISQQEVYSFSYCPQCGSPLNAKATDNFLALERAIQLNVVEQIEGFLKTTDVETVINQLKDQLK